MKTNWRWTNRMLRLNFNGNWWNWAHLFARNYKTPGTFLNLLSSVFQEVEKNVHREKYTTPNPHSSLFWTFFRCFNDLYFHICISMNPPSKPHLFLPLKNACRMPKTSARPKPRPLVRDGVGCHHILHLPCEMTKNTKRFCRQWLEGLAWPCM